ncbi:MAG: terpene cyclase/mutase family protein [Propionibacteriaceae bacterium]|nr:terpene cyclase/mutase family protein [Propionibacteriaceae bacterium]
MHNFKALIVGTCSFFLLLGAPLLAQGEPPENLTNDEYTALAAGFLARQLAASENGIYISPSDEAGTGEQYATTVYAILGMAGAGIGRDQILASTQGLIAAGEDFIGLLDEANESIPEISLMILAMKAASLDPSLYEYEGGFRDLYMDVTNQVSGDGYIGEEPYVFGQSIALLALATRDQPVPGEAIEWLLNAACSEPTSPNVGGYHFAEPGSCEDPDPDSTGLALNALHAAGVDATRLETSAAFLASRQDDLGGFFSDWSGTNTYTTGFAVAGLGSLGSHGELVERGQDYLRAMSYGCESTAAESMDTIGALAASMEVRSGPVDELDPIETTEYLFESTAQGLFGLLGGIPVPGVTTGSLSTINNEAPGPGFCRGETDVLIASPISDKSSSFWLWLHDNARTLAPYVGGALVIVVAIMIVKRKRTSQEK